MEEINTRTPLRSLMYFIIESIYFVEALKIFYFVLYCVLLCSCLYLFGYMKCSFHLQPDSIWYSKHTCPCYMRRGRNIIITNIEKTYSCDMNKLCVQPKGLKCGNSSLLVLSDSITKYCSRHITYLVNPAGLRIWHEDVQSYLLSCQRFNKIALYGWP